MKGKKSKWWLILIPLVLAVVFLAVIFWDAVVMVVAPKTVLSAAITDVFKKLEARFADCPLWIIAEGYDENGCNTIWMRLDTANDLVGDIRYDMTVQTDAANHQILAEGTAKTNGSELDLSVYLNPDFAALTSGDLLQGGFYGITYDTFSSDIRSFPLISLLIPNATIQDWENTLQEVQAFMGRSYTMPRMPEFTEEDMKMLMLGILALKSEVSKEEVTAAGQNRTCYKITYSEDGDQVKELLQYILDTEDQDDEEITASFYLYEDALVKVELSGTSGQNRIFCNIALGLDAETDDLSLQIIRDENGSRDAFSAIISTRREGERYMETISVNNTAITYDWNPGSGDMKLYLPDRNPITLTLASAESGFQIRTRDLMELLALESDAEYDCTMTVTKGAEITEPSYKNMDQWSFQDLMVLLSGVGALLGFHTA